MLRSMGIDEDGSHLSVFFVPSADVAKKEIHRLRDADVEEVTNTIRGWDVVSSAVVCSRPRGPAWPEQWRGRKTTPQRVAPVALMRSSLEMKTMRARELWVR